MNANVRIFGEPRAGRLTDFIPSSLTQQQLYGKINHGLSFLTITDIKSLSLQIHPPPHGSLFSFRLNIPNPWVSFGIDSEEPHHK